MMNNQKRPERLPGQRIALLLQGGGALGAYQAGVYQALAEHGFCPDWIAGTSIGAINGALIAGNTPDHRLARLEAFWQTVSHRDGWNVSRLPEAVRQVHSLWSALGTELAGQPGFFAPRLFNPLVSCALGSAETTSFYATAPLRATLQALIDFELINSGPIRLSLGAVQVNSGRLAYFDSSKQRIGPEHVMASGALPPGFPAVAVDGALYWDGGIYSNTPLEVVLDETPRVDTLCFMINLWNPSGREPRSLPEVLTRYKDIAYASRWRHHIETYCALHNLRRAVRALYQRLPQELRDDPEMCALADLGCHTTMHIVRLAYPARNWEMASKDLDFSWTATQERWSQGYRDARRALDRASWLQAVPQYTGVVVHELPPEDE